jgi:hypothetical protein
VDQVAHASDLEEDVVRSLAGEAAGEAANHDSDL